MTAPDRPLGPDGDPIAEAIARVRKLGAPEDYDLRALSDWDTADVYRFVAEWGPVLPQLADAVLLERSARVGAEVERDGLMLDAARTESLCHGYTDELAQEQAECERLRNELEMIRDAAADAIRDNEHVGFTVRTLHVLRTVLRGSDGPPPPTKVESK